MVSRDDLDAIAVPEFFEDIAKSVDPLAYNNPDESDRLRRLINVRRRVWVAFEEYRRRETVSIGNKGIQDEDIPW